MAELRSRVQDLEGRLEDSRVSKRNLQTKLQEVEEARKREASEAAVALQQEEREKQTLLHERGEATKMMREIFSRVRDAVFVVGLGEASVPGAGDRPGHYALGFQDVAERLAGLGEAVSRRLEEEGQELAFAVAEHTLACYRSRDPNFSLEPAVQGIDEAGEEEARGAVREAADEIAKLFVREVEAGNDDGDRSE